MEHPAQDSAGLVDIHFAEMRQHDSMPVVAVGVVVHDESWEENLSCWDVEVAVAAAFVASVGA